MAELAGFNYSQRQQPDVDCGPVSWCARITQGGRSGPQLLDMMKLPDRLAALELAQLSSIVHDLLARNTARCAPPSARRMLAVPCAVLFRRGGRTIHAECL